MICMWNASYCRKAFASPTAFSTSIACALRVRKKPGTGEINFEFLLRHLDAIGYSGWVGCEYNPRGDTREGLKWAKPYL